MKRLGTVLGLVLSLALESGWAADLMTVAVQSRAVPEERRFDATVEAVNQATVSAQVSGRIVAINFDVHDFVSRDSVILRFKSAEQRSQLEAAAAGLREAEARLNEAQIEFERVTRIFERRLVSKSVLDRARADREAAEARVDSARANVERAREQLSYTEVRAPYAGIVVKRFVEVGESVTVGQPLMAGISLEQLRLTVLVPQAAVGSFDQGAGVRVELPGGGSLAVAANRITVFPFADAATHSVRIRIDLPQGTEGLRPGTLAKVVFPMGVVERLLVPAVAVVRRSELVGVYVVADSGAVTLRQVRVGRRGPEDQIEVLAGLEAGERVAIDPLQAALSLKQTAER